MSRIDEFNRACGLLFAQLYEAFPVPISVDPVSVDFIEKRNAEDEPRLIFSATMQFLADENYIQYDRTTDKINQKQDVRLTAKGLTRLQRIPDGIQPQAKTLIDQLRDAGASIGSQVSNAAATQSVSQILKLVFTNAV